MTLTWTQIDEEHRTCPVHGNSYVARQMELEGSKAPLRDRQHWTSCPVCNQQYADEAKESQREVDGGLIYVKKKREAAEEPRGRVVSLLLAAGVPVRFADCTLKTWLHPMDPQRLIWEWAMNYTEAFDRKQGILNVFVGTPGTGKTHMGAGILASVLPRKCSGQYITVIDLLSRIRNTYHKLAQETEEQVIAELVDLDLLVIDEVGKDLPTGFSVAQFFRVVNKRHGANRHTVLIGNLSLAEFKAFAGAAMVDRIHEGGGRILPFDWGSYRSRRK